MLTGVAAVFGSQSSAARRVDLPTLSIADAAVVQYQTGNSTLVFNVTLSAASSLPVTVDFATRAGDPHVLGAGAAEEQEDYLPASGTLTFAPGETAKTIEVTVVPEPGVLNEDDEYLGLDLRAPINAILGRGSAVGTIHFTRFPRPGDVNVQSKGRQGGQCVKTASSSDCVPLAGLKQISIADIQYVNPGSGSILLESIAGRGVFYGTPFNLQETKLGKTKRPVLVLQLAGGKFGICATKGPKVGGSRSPAVLLKKKKPVRRLWGHGKGRFRTKGRYSAGTVRGTWWETLDRCDGTVTRVRTGVVDVYDFVLKKHVKVTPGHQYFAGPSKKK